MKNTRAIAVNIVVTMLIPSLSICVLGCGAININANKSTFAKTTAQSLAASAVSFVTGSFTPVQKETETHILVVGYSNGQSDQFLQSAVSRAKRYRALYPERNVVFIASPELNNLSDRDALEKFGIQVLISEENSLSSETLKKQLAPFSRIASLDFYSHSGPNALFLSSDGGKISTESSQEILASISSQFTQQAYVTLNGCNAGLFLAPLLTQVWNVPVSGAAEGTNFQQLHNNNLWYFNDAGKFPDGGWAQTNNISYSTPIACKDGGCYRMKPEGSPYEFKGGNSQQLGLGFYKFFCSKNISQESCEARMALSLVSQPSVVALNEESNEDHFRSVLLDFMCPNEINPEVRNNCVTNTLSASKNGINNYSPFQGQSLQCNFQKCEFNFSCKAEQKDKSDVSKCAIGTTNTSIATTYMAEYNSYIRGFQALSKPTPVPNPTPNPTPTPVPPSPPMGRCLKSPLASASEFQVTLRNSWNATASDIEGRAAVGGDVHLQDYSIGAKLQRNPERSDLLVGGSLWFNRGSIANGFITAQTIAFLDHLGTAAPTRIESSLSLDKIFASVNNVSARIQTLPQTGNVQVSDYGIPTVGLTLIGENTLSNVYDIDSNVLARAHSLRIQQPAGSTAIIRILGKNVQLQRFATDAAGIPNSRIVWAASEAENIFINSIGITGIFIAPKAFVRFSNGLITGQVFAMSLEGNGQINLNQFEGCIPY